MDGVEPHSLLLQKLQCRNAALIRALVTIRSTCSHLSHSLSPRGLPKSSSEKMDDHSMYAIPTRAPQELSISEKINDNGTRTIKCLGRSAIRSSFPNRLGLKVLLVKRSCTLLAKCAAQEFLGQILERLSQSLFDRHLYFRN